VYCEWPVGAKQFQQGDNYICPNVLKGAGTQGLVGRKLSRSAITHVSCLTNETHSCEVQRAQFCGHLGNPIYLGLVGEVSLVILK
jgi:hypothetical protein